MACRDCRGGIALPQGSGFALLGSPSRQANGRWLASAAPVGDAMR